MSHDVKIAFASGALGSVLFTAMVGNPFVGAALGVLLVLLTAAVLMLLEDIPPLTEGENNGHETVREQGSCGRRNEDRPRRGRSQ